MKKFIKFSVSILVAAVSVIVAAVVTIILVNIHDQHTQVEADEWVILGSIVFMSGITMAVYACGNNLINKYI